MIFMPFFFDNQLMKKCLDLEIIFLLSVCVCVWLGFVCVCVMRVCDEGVCVCDEGDKGVRVIRDWSLSH